MSIPIRAVPLDEGTGYQRKRVSHDGRLTEVGRGTPMGELLRRYWHPVGLSSHATDTPREVRILGEDLVLYRDKKGRPGLLHNRCCHRGTTLYYGRVEEEGIRCCYHGWLFDAEGRCLEQPCEPEGGAAHRGKVRQRRELAAKVPASWLAVASKARIELCEFRYECPQKWENLQPIDGSTTRRFCGQCQKAVTYFDDVEEARWHAAFGGCVAIDARVVRTKGDLYPRYDDTLTTVGILMDAPTPEETWERAQRLRDEIERRKEE